MNQYVIHKQADHGPQGSAGYKMPIHTQFFQQAILNHKVGHTDTVLGVRSGFISRSVQATLQVSVCISYDLCLTG